MLQEELVQTGLMGSLVVAFCRRGLRKMQHQGDGTRTIAAHFPQTGGTKSNSQLPPDTPPRPPKLLDQMRQRMRLEHLALDTEKPTSAGHGSSSSIDSCVTRASTFKMGSSLCLGALV